MTRVFELSNDEVLEAIAQAVVDRHMPLGAWLADVELDINTKTHRIDRCVVKVSKKQAPTEGEP